MKVNQITTAFLKNKNNFDFFVVNFANADMVGHTGNIQATKTAVEAVDAALGRIVEEFSGTIFITADHGNAEDKSAKFATTHTTHNVPLVIVNGPARKLISGELADVAPTILDVMKLPKPKEMTGKSVRR